MRNICVIGTGYVGLVTGACYAHLGNRVVCVDIDEKKIEQLQVGIIPIYEPELEDIVRYNLINGRLAFTTDLKRAITNADVIFIAVGTPSLPGGAANMEYVYQAAASIAKSLDHYAIVIIKSTVPVGTAERVAKIISEDPGTFVDVVSNPEFLREGRAVHDCLYPERIVLGLDESKQALLNAVLDLNAPFDAPFVVVDHRTAEMIKYASNAFLAAKISFINEVAHICEGLGADIKGVAEGMGHDSRIGSAFLQAGIGYGGSCFPKDVRALAHMARTIGYEAPLLCSVMDVNEQQRMEAVHKLNDIMDVEGKTIAVLGLAFKPNTDDVREAPSIDIIAQLCGMGATVKAYDPAAMANASLVLPEEVIYAHSVPDALKGSYAVVIATEWEQFNHIDWRKARGLMKMPVIIDGRNMLEPDMMIELGYVYKGIGRRISKQSPQRSQLQPAQISISAPAYDR